MQIKLFYYFIIIYFFKGIIIECISSEFHTESYQFLDYDTYEPDDEIIDLEEIFNETDDESDNESPETQGTQSSTSSFTNPIQTPKVFIPFEYKRRAVEYWQRGKTKKYKYVTVKNQFKQIRSRKQFDRWKIQVQQSGDRVEKLRIVFEFAAQKFKNAREKKLNVSDLDVKRWAINKAREVGLDGFKASNYWLWKFKNSIRVVNRKVTKFVTQNYNTESININETADLFVKSSQQHFKDKNYSKSEIFNSDQSGFNLEVHSGRTLEYKGVKTVEMLIQSKSAMTHSYSIQPTISADGYLLSPLYIVLKEEKGNFGPRIKPRIDKLLEKIPNVYVSSSKSGKLTKQHLIEWFDKIYFPQAPIKSVILLDSWTTYNDTRAIEDVKPSGKSYDVLRIPPKTTAIIQPCDVFFFRIWKTFVRRFSDRVLLDEINIELNDRFNIIKLQSIVHNQFSAPRFKKFLKYSWFKCGYFDDRPERFLTPVEYCFNLKDNTCFEMNSQCSEGSFIICAYCEHPLCFTHCFNDIHLCNL